MSSLCWYQEGWSILECFILVIYLQILYFFGQEDGGRGGGVIGAVDDSDQQKTKQRCVTHSKDHALQVSTLAMAWFFMPCNVFYAVYRWAYFSFGTNMHWTLEKRGKRNIFPSFGCKTLTHSSQEFEYWRKYFQPLNPFSNFISSANCISPVGAKGSHRDVGISLI